MKEFTQNRQVASRDIDAMNHVNNVVYVQWVQDVAEAHWKEVASDEMKARYAWVVLKHEIEYLKPALLGDEVILKTWVESATGVRSERCVEIFRANSQQLLTRARTSWCLLDAATFRPRRIEDDIRAVFLES